ncbi:hypothetical protein P9H28_10930, partial [Paenibacillus barengoltzii]|uniref:hypothetical protein n=1 Tax=Paenibacillus barengoltzii TaxID=343517 RepID=UPI002DB7BA47
ILMPPQLVAFCSENSVLILLIVVVDFTYKVLLSLGVVFQVNTILPKIRSPFHIFKKRYFRNSGLFVVRIGRNRHFYPTEEAVSPSA